MDMFIANTQLSRHKTLMNWSRVDYLCIIV